MTAFLFHYCNLDFIQFRFCYKFNYLSSFSKPTGLQAHNLKVVYLQYCYLILKQ